MPQRGCSNDLITARVRNKNPNALFALSLAYQRNGNIEEAQWKSTYFSPKKYTYKYDAINRIESATYKQIAAGNGSSLANDIFSVSGITYDAIGNIKTLTRRGVTGCGPEMVTGEIDRLTYNYPGTGDISRLENITDNAPNPKLFEQGVKPQDEGEYTYDGAGRMTFDPHRDLTIEYNHLDLPRKIDTPDGTVEITYDATGRKFLHELKGKYRRRYAGPLTFVKKTGEDDYVLEAASTGDGRLVFDAEHEELYPEYHHKDHLGNVRVSFTDRNKDKLVEIIGDANEVTQVMDFYPFGLQQQGEGVFGPVVESSNRYRFNGKELVEDIGLYDYGARWYDPAVGRWTSIDPLASTYASMSPYNYVANNPIKYLDPDGMRIQVSFQGEGARELYAYILKNAFENQYEASFTAVEGKENTFEVNVVATEGGGKFDNLTDNAKAFYNEFTRIAKDQNYTADMDIVIDDPNVDVGNYKTQAVDVGDIAALPMTDVCNPEQCGPTQAGKIIHETNEQFGKAVDGRGRGDDRGFGPNHEIATSAENSVNGNTRGRDGWGGANGAIQRFESTRYGTTVWQFNYSRTRGKRSSVKRVDK